MQLRLREGSVLKSGQGSDMRSGRLIVGGGKEPARRYNDVREGIRATQKPRERLHKRPARGRGSRLAMEEFEEEGRWAVREEDS